MSAAQKRFNVKDYVLKPTESDDNNCVGCVFEIISSRHTFEDGCKILEADARYTSTSIGCTIAGDEYTYIKSLKKTLTEL